MSDELQSEATLERSSEASDLDFKSEFDGNRPGDWLEIIKDIVAFANSGGGSILIGVNDDGSPSGSDVTGILSTDPADLTNRIHKYTGTHFHEFEISKAVKGATDVCVIAVRGNHIPMVFTNVGTYEVAPKKQKTAFSVGTVYFRHGAKSEPGTSDDLRGFLERELEAIRDSWLSGIAKVVEAPVGSRFAILPPETQAPGPLGVLPIKLTDDPNAPAYYAVPIDKTHPFRQKEVVLEVNKRLEGGKAINSHDILCIRRVFEIQKNIEFCYTQNYASPRYSEKLVDWIASKYQEDSEFFVKTKERFDKLKAESTGR